MLTRPLALVGLTLLFLTGALGAAPLETQAERDERMAWWREARFGLFIHWGLYAIPAGEWEGRVIPGASEWIMNSARITPADYEPLRGQFNPTAFDARRWVAIAKDAGMKYIVITSKHHDGFCLWDSQHTDWDVMSSPFARDALKELAEACTEAGIRLCFYHSIMDWTHPDYLPRRAWDDRSTEEADFDRYRAHMKAQLEELLSGRYGDVGVLWFDGEWEPTWTHEFGADLDDFVRGLKPDLIVNNRVDVGREGMAGHTRDGSYRGDFGTPEQEIPATGLRGPDGSPEDWETCMTMNGSWGFHRHDENWKSSETLIRMLCDIASKGGNFLLNVGPTAEGEIPAASVERLAAIGSWLRSNGEAIYGTGPSLFAELPWGRSTTRMTDEGARIYCIVFDRPSEGELRVPGLVSDVEGATLLADGSALPTRRRGADLFVTLPASAPDDVATVLALDVAGEPRIIPPFRLLPERSIFVEAVQVWPGRLPEGLAVHYTVDGSEPTPESPLLKAIALRATTTVKARAFFEGEPFGEVIERRFERLVPWPVSTPPRDLNLRLERETVSGRFESTADLQTALTEDRAPSPEGFTLPEEQANPFGVAWRGYLMTPHAGLYTFRIGSDDGSRLLIDGRVVVDNDGAHAYRVVEGFAPLAQGSHLFELFYFNRGGDKALTVEWTTVPGTPFQPLTALNFLTVSRSPATGRPPPQREAAPGR